MPRNNDLKILLIDIETSPNLVWAWGLWDQNISLSQIKESGTMLCFAAKWLDGKKITFKSVNDEDMLETAHRLMDESDAIVHYNGESFDIPILNREFLLAEFDPPSPSRQIDLYKVVRSKFRFTSNKLDWVSQALGLAGKEEHAGFHTWLGCMNNNAKAWRDMKRYNIQDTRMLEDLYYRLLPWNDKHPNVNLYSNEDGCPNCGGFNLVRRGFSYTRSRKYRQLRCSDCGRWCRSTNSVSGTKVQPGL